MFARSPVAVVVDEGVDHIDGGCLNSAPAGDLLLGWEPEQRRLDRASQVAALFQGPICPTDSRAVTPSVFL